MQLHLFACDSHDKVALGSREVVEDARSSDLACEVRKRPCAAVGRDDGVEHVVAVPALAAIIDVVAAAVSVSRQFRLTFWPRN